MRIAVVGCGSIGIRRARLIREAWGHDFLFMDTQDVRAYDAARSFEGAPIWEPEPVDAVLICTPPGSGRPEQVKAWRDVGATGIFVEKPLALDASDVDEVGYLNLTEHVTMGACNLRFTPRVESMRATERPWRLLNLTMRQNAMHWSPEHEAVSLVLDSIHELDLAVYMNGPATSIRGWSELNAAEVSVHHRDGGLTHIFLDRLADPPQRRMEIVTPKDRVSMRITTDDGMYRREMQHFLECVAAGRQTCNPLADMAALTEMALEVA